MGSLPGLAGLAEYDQVLLTTFRRDGTPVATQVWLVPDGTDLLVITGATTGKVARLRHSPRVLVTPCDSRGRPVPGRRPVPATAELLTGPADVRYVRQRIYRRYRLRYTLATALPRLRRTGQRADTAIRISALPALPADN